VSRSVETDVVVSNRLYGPVRLAIVAALIVTPLVFGGVHTPVYAPLEIAFFLSAVAVLIAGNGAASGVVFQGDTARLLRATGVCLLTVALVRTGWSWFDGSPHPVFGIDAEGATLAPALRGIREFLFFAAVVYVVRVSLVGRPFSVMPLINLLTAIGVGCAFIGLAHWFYDTGRLFWLFEPENIFISDRARWPFVNSNHLAAFLLPTFFILVARIGECADDLRSAVYSRRTGQPRKLAEVISSARAQHLFVTVGGWGICLVAVTMCVLATLSRGVWLSAVAGIVMFFIAEAKTRPAAESTGGGDFSAPRSGEVRSRRRRSKSVLPLTSIASPRVRRWALAGLVVALVIGAYSTIGDRGTDLIERRIEYGLLHSKEDMRLQLMSDTAPILRSNLVFGVGLGGWSAEYARHMSPLLTGIDPMYLHNEPAQLLVELGLVGLIPLAVGIGLFVRGAVRTLATSRYRLVLLALLTGAPSTLFATVFDFHLRIPAIVFQLAVLTGLISFLADSAPPRAP